MTLPPPGSTRPVPLFPSTTLVRSLWGLSVDEQMALLGVSARSTFFKWKKDPDTILPSDTLERISYIVGIYKALQVLLPDEKAADEWVRHPNTDRKSTRLNSRH